MDDEKYKRIVMDPLYQDTLSIVLLDAQHSGSLTLPDDILEMLDKNDCLDPLTASLALVDIHYDTVEKDVDLLHQDVRQAVRSLYPNGKRKRSLPDVILSGSVAAASYALLRETANPEEKMDALFYEYGAAIVIPMAEIWKQTLRVLLSSPLMKSLPGKVLLSCAKFAEVLNQHSESPELKSTARILRDASVPPAPKPPETPVQRIKVKRPEKGNFNL